MLVLSPLSFYLKKKIYLLYWLLELTKKFLEGKKFHFSGKSVLKSVLWSQWFWILFFNSVSKFWLEKERNPF